MRPSSSTALCSPSSSAPTRTMCSSGSACARQLPTSVDPPAVPPLPAAPPQRKVPGRRWYLPFYQFYIAVYVYTMICDHISITKHLSNALYLCIRIRDHFLTTTGKSQVQSWQASHHQPRDQDGGAAKEQGQGETNNSTQEQVHQQCQVHHKLRDNCIFILCC